ncbi:MAG: amidohydrolase [Deltaproteobacteria bacterium]|nr:amidohydrolase [Deltaproteobacteria bacterium]
MPTEPPIEALSAAEALAAAQEILPWVCEIRRDFHQHPELGLEEHRTSARVQALLREMGVEFETGFGGTGVLGLIPGSGQVSAERKADGQVPTVALRADLDALPIQDAKDVPYKSKIPGKMHACGHDVHTAILLGTARLLSGWRERFPGLVKLLFQPAEETVGGAKFLIAGGALENPKVEAVFGLHVDSELEVGRFAFHFGQRNASSDTVRLILNGRSCHAAYPAGGVDAIVMAAQVVSALQAVVSRNVDARDSAVVSFGTIHGGTQGNIMADRVELTGTVRILDTRIRQRVLQRIRETAEGIASALGGSAEVEIEPGYDALVNDDGMVKLVQENARVLVGQDSIVVRERPNMGVEDFAYYLNHAPGAFFSLGVRNEERGIVHGEHQEGFDVDEACMAYGVAIQVLNASRFLQLGR